MIFKIPTFKVFWKDKKFHDFPRFSGRVGSLILVQRNMHVATGCHLQLNAGPSVD